MDLESIWSLHQIYIRREEMMRHRLEESARIWEESLKHEPKKVHQNYKAWKHWLRHWIAAKEKLVLSSARLDKLISSLKPERHENGRNSGQT